MTSEEEVMKMRLLVDGDGTGDFDVSSIMIMDNKMERLTMRDYTMPLIHIFLVIPYHESCNFEEI